MKEQWVGWRNRMLGSAEFKAWATRFPLTRGVARARAREAFDLVGGFVYSQVLAACVELGVLARLQGGAATTDDIADATNLPVEAAQRLLRAAASLKLVELVSDSTWMLGRTGVAIVSDPGIVAMVRHHALLYRDLADPVAMLRRKGGGDLSAFWPYAEGRVGDVGDYSALMAASQPMVAAQAIAAYDFARHRRILDVGGGQGVFVAAVGEAAPALHRAVFDLRDVVARITDPAVERVGGSFLTDPLPTGFDLLTLVRILHDHDDSTMLHILGAAKAAMAPGATLLIVEPMAGVAGAEAMADAYFGFYLLAMGTGRARSFAELENALVVTGFRSVRRIGTNLPIVTGMVVAKA